MKTILMKTMSRKLVSVRIVLVEIQKKDYRIWGSVRDPETPRDSGWPTGSGLPLGGLNVVERVYGITGA